MIRRTRRRGVTVLGAAAVFLAIGLPVFSGTASAATVSASPSTAANSGTVTVTLTSSASIASATSATLTKHNDPAVSIDSSSLAAWNPTKPTQRVAQFPLTNKLPGAYDITLHETGGTETCVSTSASPCFTISGLFPTVHLDPPTAIVVGSTGNGTLTLANPARGDVYSGTRLRMELSGDAGLKASDMTFTAEINGAAQPTTLEDSGTASVFAFIGAPAGFSLGQNQTLVFSLVFGAKPGTPTTPTLSITTTYGHVDGNGDLTDVVAQDENEPSAITNVPPGTTYHSVAPIRVLDTRSGTTGALGPGSSLVLVVGGKNGVPTTAKAAVLNLTATGSPGSGYLVAYPTGTARPTASSLNYNRGANVANLAVVPLGPSSHALVISNPGTARVHVLADLIGYYDTTTGGSGYTPLAPARVLDTRASGGALAPGASRTLAVAGNGGVPASSATGVAVNVTVTQGQKQGYLLLYKTGTTPPATSNLDFNPNQTIANLAIVDLDSGGQFTIVNHSSGTVHVLIDVQGYFVASTASSLHVLSINRVVDTRANSGAPLAGGATMTVDLGGHNGVPSTGITMLAVNITITQPGRSGYLTVYSANDTQPAASNVQFLKGQTVAELAYVKASDSGNLKIFNASSSPAHVIVDVEGFGTSP